MLIDTGLADVMHVLKLACGDGAYAKTDALMATEPPTGNAVIAPAGYSFRPLCRELGMGPASEPAGAGGHANCAGVEPKPVAGVAIGSMTVGHGSPAFIEKLKYSIVCICRASTQLPAGSRDPKSIANSPLDERPAAVTVDKQRVSSTPPRMDDVQFWVPRDSIYAPA